MSIKGIANWSPCTKSGRFVGIGKITSTYLEYFEDENIIRSCANTFPIENNGTQSMRVREHDTPHETSVGPNTAHNYVK